MSAKIFPLLLILVSQVNGQAIIAHRGASGYLPEHTLAAAAMAYQMGVDYIEQDVVLTQDNVPVVLHDIHLDTVSDVAEKFPKRAREDGRFYALDFSLNEIKTLRLTERFNFKSKKAVFPRRFPTGQFLFQIPTLAEEIKLVQGLNESTGKNVGVYVEIKSPNWHRRQGHDISVCVLDVLREFGYTDQKDQIYLQCFDQKESKRLRNNLKTKLKLVQLIESKRWRESSKSVSARLREIATYANGIGPPLSLIIDDVPDEEISLTAAAHKAGLVVHPYTVRTDQLPSGYADVRQLTKKLFEELKVDGVFTDHPEDVMTSDD